MAQHKFRLFILSFSFFCITAFANSKDKLPIEVKQQLLMADYLQALPQLKQLAELKNSQAQYQLAQLYLNGLGVEKSIKKAKYWLKEAANKNAKASYLLGSLYWQGKLLTQDKQQALYYLKLAKAQGSRKASNLLMTLENSQQHNINRLQHLFFNAITQGNVSQTAKLLQQGIKLNLINKQGETALIVAIKQQQKKMALWLIEQARKQQTSVAELLKFDARDRHGNSVLHLAIIYRQPEVVNSLIRYKAPLNSLNYKKETPLILAVNTKQLVLAQQLVNEGAALNVKDNQGMTALDYATKFNLSLAIKNKKAPTISLQQSIKQKTLALKQQAQDNNSPYFGWPILAIAVAQKQQKLIDELIKQGQDPWYFNHQEYDHSAIATALRNGETKLVINFLGVKTKQKVSDKAIEYLFSLAIKYNNIKVLDALLAQVNLQLLSQAPIEKSPLWQAIYLNNYDAFMHLSAVFSVKNKMKKQKTSYLLLATEKNFTPIAQQLIAMGVNVNVLNDKGRNALWYAAEHRNKTLVMALLQAHSHVDQADDQGYTPLMRAVIRNCFDCVELLLRYGADPEKQTINANTALMFAAQGKANILALMLRSNINIKARNKNSYTPLMLAIKANCEQCVKLLLKAGANPKRKNEQGENAFDLAKDNPLLLTLLKS